MGSGGIDTTGTIALIATALILGSFFIARMIAAVRVDRPRLPQLAIYGDFPHAPEGAKAATRKTGGRAASGSGQQAHSNDIAHRNGGVTR